jgi:cytochrome c oxidase subunit 4
MAAHEHSEHSIGFYVAILIALLILTGITVAAAFVNLHAWNPIVALAIASIKAVLVVLFFMHVKDASEKMTKVVIFFGVFFLMLLLALTMADYGTRLWT